MLFVDQVRKLAKKKCLKHRGDEEWKSWRTFGGGVINAESVG